MYAKLQFKSISSTIVEEMSGLKHISLCTSVRRHISLCFKSKESDHVLNFDKIWVGGYLKLKILFS